MEPTEQNEQTEALLPPALLAKVEARAVVEHRSAREMLREAVERYLHDLRPVAESNAERPAQKRSPQEAGARMLARRQFHHLPEGVTIRDLMTYGRA